MVAHANVTVCAVERRKAIEPVNLAEISGKKIDPRGADVALEPSHRGVDLPLRERPPHEINLHALEARERLSPPSDEIGAFGALGLFL